MVEAWAEDYIRFERRQSSRTSCGPRSARGFDSSPLHQTNSCMRPSLAPSSRPRTWRTSALYYIDDSGASFDNAARYGLRFELATNCPPSRTGRDYAYGYRYELRRRDTACRHWREERELASWDWVDLGAFAGPKKLEQVWLALRRHYDVHVSGTLRVPSTPFAVRVAIRPPQGVVPRLGDLVKGIIDGVVCAFRSHTDRSSVVEVATRVADTVEACGCRDLIRAHGASFGPSAG